MTSLTFCPVSGSCSNCSKKIFSSSRPPYADFHFPKADSSWMWARWWCLQNRDSSSIGPLHIGHATCVGNHPILLGRVAVFDLTIITGVLVTRLVLVFAASRLLSVVLDFPLCCWHGLPFQLVLENPPATFHTTLVAGPAETRTGP